MSWRIPSATLPDRNPTIEPKEDLREAWNVFLCITSTNKTAMKGSIIIPNGGKIKLPMITVIEATLSPHLLPPNFFTDHPEATTSAKSKATVITPIKIQKNQVNSAGLMKK